MKNHSDEPSIGGFLQGQNTSALGSFLQFIGSACYDFNKIASDPGQPVLVQALNLAGLWKDFFIQSQVSAPIDSLEKDITKLMHNNSSLDMALKDYNDLFHAPDLSVALWESVWLSQEKTLFTSETRAVKEWYKRFHWEISRVGYEAEDHIGLETAFCGWLFDRSMTDCAQLMPGNQAQPGLEDVESFLTEHYSRWAPQCFARLAQAASTNFWVHSLQSAAAISRSLA